MSDQEEKSIDGVSIQDEVRAEMAAIQERKQALHLKVQQAILETKKEITAIEAERDAAVVAFNERIEEKRAELAGYRDFLEMPKEGARDTGVGKWVRWFMAAHALGGPEWTMDRALERIMSERPQTYKPTARKNINGLANEGILLKEKVDGEVCFKSILSVDWETSSTSVDQDLFETAQKIAATNPEAEPEPEPEGATERQLEIVVAFQRKLGHTDSQMADLCKREIGVDLDGILRDDAKRFIEFLSSIKVATESFAVEIGTELQGFLGSEERKTMKTKEVEWMRQGHGLTKEELQAALDHLQKTGVVDHSWRSDGLLVAQPMSRVGDENVTTTTAPLFNDAEIPPHA